MSDPRFGRFAGSRSPRNCLFPLSVSCHIAKDITDLDVRRQLLTSEKASLIHDVELWYRYIKVYSFSSSCPSSHPGTTIKPPPNATATPQHRTAVNPYLSSCMKCLHICDPNNWTTSTSGGICERVHVRVRKHRVILERCSPNLRCVVSLKRRSETGHTFLLPRELSLTVR